MCVFKLNDWTLSSMRLFLRMFSYLFQLAIAVPLAAIGVVTAASGLNNLHLGMLPWEGARLTYGVLALGFVGILITVLAIFGRLKILFPLWSGLIFFLMFRGFILSSYSFAGPEQFRGALWLTFGALGAFLSSWTVLQSSRNAY